MTLLYVFWAILGVALVTIGAISQLKGSRGKWGERLVRSILFFLPSEYRVFNDVRICCNGKKCQIDHLVVSPYGIFVIETKSYLGLTTGHSRDRMWRRRVLGMNYFTRSPLFQNQYHLDVLCQYLGFVSGFRSDWMKSVVVFGFGSIVRILDKPENVMTFFSLYRYVRRHRKILLTDSQLGNVSTYLKKKSVYQNANRVLYN